jgi:hypothetical protein
LSIELWHRWFRYGFGFFLGSGKILAAQVVPGQMLVMQKMAKMDMKMELMHYSPKKDERFKIKEEYGMQMDMSRILQKNGHESF